MLQYQASLRWSLNKIQFNQGPPHSSSTLNNDEAILNFVHYYFFIIKMFSQSELIERERRALCTLAQISNEDERMMCYHWTKKDQTKKIKSHNKDRQHRVSANIQNVKPEKLPMIIAKNNLNENNSSFIKSNHRLNNYILFEKGLGAYGTVSFNKKRGRYLEENSKFIKLYSESSEQEIDLVKEWLSIKKQSCKEYNSLLCKRKKSTVKEENYKCLSIKNIL